MNLIKKLLLRIMTFICHPSTLFYYSNFKGTIIYPSVVLKRAKLMRITNSIICRNSVIKVFFNNKVQKYHLLFNNVFLCEHAYVSSYGTLTIEDASIAPNVFIGTYNHSITKSIDDSSYKIIIIKPKLIGQNVSIIGNVFIDEGSVIGAGSVVTKDVPKNTMVVGNPAKPIKCYLPQYLAFNYSNYLRKAPASMLD